MRRREFILSLGGAAAWSLAIRSVDAQQPKVWRIGYLAATAPTAIPVLWGAFREGLRDRGYIEGQNLTIESRWANPPSRVHAIELANLNVDVIVAWATHAVTAAKAATSTIPIVMVGIADPVGPGFVASLAKPGGNITGTTNLARDLGGKLVELLLRLVPEAKHIAALRNPKNPASALQYREVEVAARTLGLKLDGINITNKDDIAVAFAQMTGHGIKGVVALADPLLISQGKAIADQAVAARLPIIFARRESVDVGGLISYGPSLRGQFRDTAIYVDKILKGSKPADLPVEQPTRLELVINLKTAKAMGIDVPLHLQQIADDVIE
jgi:putative tryptophan/tyrosine transport system substrate-binding protein